MVFLYRNLKRKKEEVVHLFMYRKAFDSVNRVALWRKLLRSNIDGKIIKVNFNIMIMLNLV